MPPAKRTAKPVILISARHTVSRGRDRPELTRLYAAYYDAVTAAGGLPLVAPPLGDPDDVARLLGVADGVLLTGGYDLRPETYGQPRHPKTRLMTQRRETFELALARAALERSTPILAICLGIQVLNVAAGGTLHQHVPDVVGHASQSSAARGHRPARRHPSDLHRQAHTPDAHVVVLDRGSLAARVMGTTRLSVNSTHHQAVDRVGTGLRVSGRCEADGLVEAIEGGGRPTTTSRRNLPMTTSRRSLPITTSGRSLPMTTSGRSLPMTTSRRSLFVLGVQWHPERLTDRPAHLALFRGLVQAARRKRT